MADESRRSTSASRAGRCCPLRREAGRLRELRKALGEDRGDALVRAGDDRLEGLDRPVAGRLRADRDRRAARRLLAPCDRALLRLLRTRGHAPVLEQPRGRTPRAGEHGALWLGIAALRAQPCAPSGRARRLLANTADQAGRAAAAARPRAGAAPLEPTISVAAPIPRRTRPRRSPRPVLSGAAALRRSTRPRGAMALTRPYLGVHYPSDVGRRRAARLRRRSPELTRTVKIGIVGLPNAGKSSLFNALTRAGAAAANYPFTTVEPNVAVVGVPDERLDRVAETIGATPVVHETIAVPRHRRARARRARRARGSATSSSATSARPTRSCTSCAPTTTRRWCTPRAASTRSRTSRRSRRSCSTPTSSRPSAGSSAWPSRPSRGDKEAVAEERWLREVLDGAAEPAAASRTVAAAGGRARRRASACRRSPSKPVLYVANVAEGEPLEPPPELVEHARERGAARRR